MRFEKSPPWLIQLFDARLANTRGERRQMFGYPCGFANGNMFCGLFGADLFVRLSEGDRAELLRVPGAMSFDPMGGKPMREYVVVPREMVDDEEPLRGWIDKALIYTESLPPKIRSGARVKAQKAQKAKPLAKARASGSSGRSSKKSAGSGQSRRRRRAR
jgi:TfoX/Sxy family transcriptional regulator of competence genes